MKAMNKKLLKWLAITACSLTCATTLGVGVSTLDNPQTATAYEITFESADALKSAYMHGSTLTVPMGTIEGVQATSYMVITPSGYAYDSKTFTLSEAGRYTIRWFATVGGKEVSAEKTFLVEKALYGTEGKVTYEERESFEYAILSDKETITADDMNPADQAGLKVSLAEDSVFTYNRVINLNDLSGSPFINLHPYYCIANIKYAVSTGDILYQEDARNYYVTLTDCYDSSKSVTIEMEYLQGGYWMNIRAGANGQKADANVLFRHPFYRRSERFCPSALLRTHRSKERLFRGLPQAFPSKIQLLGGQSPRHPHP